MKCTKCGENINYVRWAEIMGNDKYQAIGGNDNDLTAKHSTAYQMKLKGYWKDEKIEVIEFNHCFNCGHKNLMTRIEYK